MKSLPSCNLPTVEQIINMKFVQLLILMLVLVVMAAASVARSPLEFEEVEEEEDAMMSCSKNSDCPRPKSCQDSWRGRKKCML